MRNKSGKILFSNTIVLMAVLEFDFLSKDLEYCMPDFFFDFLKI